jgi:hypothetical protein
MIFINHRFFVFAEVSFADFFRAPGPEASEMAATLQ